MQLTLFSDYSLRVLLYLATHDGRLVRVEEIAEAYGISRNHLQKVVQSLVQHGWIQATRGRGGGLRLLRAANEIGIGAIVRECEPTLELVECLNPKTNRCPISPACGLKGALEEARRAFFEVLDQYTLAQFAKRPESYAAHWKKPRSKS